MMTSSLETTYCSLVLSPVLVIEAASVRMIPCWDLHLLSFGGDSLGSEQSLPCTSEVACVPDEPGLGSAQPHAPPSLSPVLGLHCSYL